jgi:hypothetical protein
MARDIICTKLALTGLEGFLDGWGTAMGQRTFKASAVAFVLGLVVSLVWSFLHAYGL